MTIIACGGRDFRDRLLLFRALDYIDLTEGGVDMLVEGGHRVTERGRIVGSADFFAHEWAVARGIAHETMNADWKRWGAAAGSIRNEAMLKRWQPQAVVAFRGGSGTQDMIDRARLARTRVIEVPKDLAF